MVSGILVEKSSTKQIVEKKNQNFFSFLESNKKNAHAKTNNAKQCNA